MLNVQMEDLMIPSLFICSECKEIEEDRTNVVTCAECSVGSGFTFVRHFCLQISHSAPHCRLGAL